jgi:predicted dehydrogenase
MSKGAKICSGGTMQGFAAPALKKVRVGVVGLGMRGPGAVHRLANIPGVEVCGLCDLYASASWIPSFSKSRVLRSLLGASTAFADTPLTSSA